MTTADQITSIVDDLLAGRTARDEAVRRLLALHDVGEFALTPKQEEIGVMLVRGCPQKEMADKLKVAQRTIRRHLAEIYKRTGTLNAASAAARLAPVLNRTVGRRTEIDKIPVE